MSTKIRRLHRQPGEPSPPWFALVAVPVLSVLLSSGMAMAADWGYEWPEATSSDSKSENSGGATGNSQAPEATAGADAAQPLAASEPRSGRVADQWLEIFALCSGSELTGEQRRRLESLIDSELRSSRAEDFRSVARFWPAVRGAMEADPQQRDGYRDLFRALLRLRLRAAAPPAEHKAVALKLGEKPPAAAAPAVAPSIGDGPTAEEVELLGEILGPSRVAMDGDPPLTEDAVNSYADMAVFLYEQQHPGRTIEGTDNRTMFASLICDRFQDAPTRKDREAIVHFDLAWARLRILWASASPAERRSILDRWNNPSTTTGGAPVRNALLDRVLASGPWRSLLAASPAASRQTGSGRKPL